MNEPVWSARRPASFWIRAAALVIDVTVFALVSFSLRATAAALWGREADESALIQVTATAFTLLFTALYTTVLHATDGQTLGKLVAGVRVVDLDGAPLPGGAAFLRYLAYFPSALPLGFGFFMAGLRRDKRALHDLIAGSRVERLARPPRRASVPASESTPAGVA